MGIHAEDIEGLFLAALLGAIIGIDREYRGKAAGFRTLMLVSLGSAVFSLVSYKMALMDPYHKSDVTRIASLVVSGIGFLGAGIIFRNGQDVRGLTTAATIWMAAAVGMASGIGSFTLAIIATAITWITLFFLHFLENMIEQFFHTEKYKITWKIAQGAEIDCKDFLEGRAYDLKENKLSKSGDFISAEWTVQSSRKVHDELISRLLKDPRIVKLEH